MSSIWASAWPSESPLGCASLRAALRLGALLALAFAATAPAQAKVFYSQTQAVELAFPDADRVETETFVLDDAQRQRIEELSRSRLDSKLVRVWRGFKGNELQGYALIDVHEVRTHPEAFMIVLDPSGSVRSLRVLAFHEPLEYMPTERWYRQFTGRSRADPLRLGGDVDGIVGATLSAQATTQGVRRALAIHQVLLQGHP